MELSVLKSHESFHKALRWTIDGLVIFGVVPVRYLPCAIPDYPCFPTEIYRTPKRQEITTILPLSDIYSLGLRPNQYWGDMSKGFKHIDKRLLGYWAGWALERLDKIYESEQVQDAILVTVWLARQPYYILRLTPISPVFVTLSLFSIDPEVIEKWLKLAIAFSNIDGHWCRARRAVWEGNDKIVSGKLRDAIREFNKLTEPRQPLVGRTPVINPF